MSLWERFEQWLEDPFNSVLVISGFAGLVGGAAGGVVGVVVLKVFS
jgi:uncharacterized membrane protein